MATALIEQSTGGKHWVEEVFRQLADEYHVAVGDLRWRDDYPGPYLSSLYFRVRDAHTAEAIEFPLYQLEACTNPANRAARALIRDQIRGCLGELREHVGQSEKRP